MHTLVKACRLSTCMAWYVHCKCVSSGIKKHPLEYLCIGYSVQLPVSVFQRRSRANATRTQEAVH